MLGRYREKDFGVWRAFTWADYEARIRDFALGLRELGIGAGDVVALIGDNRPDWVDGRDRRARARRPISLGLYRDALEEEVAYLLDARARVVVFAEDEEQVDKLLNVCGPRAEPAHIVYSDPRGTAKVFRPAAPARRRAGEARRGGARRARVAATNWSMRPRARGGDPLHHLRHHRAAEARHAVGRRA